MGTIGGNICLDTRCTYYDQNHEWRKSISYCMKCEGETCWVAPSSKRCLAVSSTDTAPALMALGARVVLHGPDGERELPLGELYDNDGIAYLTRRPDEILRSVRLDAGEETRSTYWKLRRRGSFDFPVLSVAAAGRIAPDGTVERMRIVLGAVASSPQAADEAAASLVGKRLDDEAIEAAAASAARLAKPMDNTDFTLHWRKRVAARVRRLRAPRPQRRRRQRPPAHGDAVAPGATRAKWTPLRGHPGAVRRRPADCSSKNREFRVASACFFEGHPNLLL